MKKILPKSKLLLIAIVLIGAFFRFYDINWDQGQHLHPDERFLTMVGNAMKIPPSFIDYLNPQVSTINPANIGFNFYVYGTFPVALNKLIGFVANTNEYDPFTFMGRTLSGFLDLLLIILVFKTAELFEKRGKLDPLVKYWAALFYAIAVLPIQLSHFFTVDTFLNTFMFISFYSALRFSFTKGGRWLFLSGIFFGLAIASKVTAIFLGALLLYLLISAYSEMRRVAKENLPHLFGDLLLFGITSYLVMRISDPYLFQDGNFFNLHISPLFLENLQELKDWSSPQAWYPPGVQWIHKTPVVFALKNLVLYGVGIGYAACIVLGGYYLFRKIRQSTLYIIFTWVILFFLYQSMQITQTMRYFLIIYPFLALLAGIGFTYLVKQTNRYVQALLLLMVIIWPLFFFSIYTKPISRVTASLWIYATIPPQNVILTESWDDALPLSLDGMTINQYIIKQLPVFDPDTQQKWDKMHELLDQGDYLILSSNRGWGSIPTVPERYPEMTKFYHDLFAEKTDYRKVAQFTSYPSLTYLGIPLTIPDDNAEEAFTVYDHPKVLIFKHIR